MPTRHCTSTRTSAALMLPVLAFVLLMLLVPHADAAETISLSSNVTLRSKTLDGVVLDVVSTSPVKAALLQCTVEGGGLNVTYPGAGSASSAMALTLYIFDTFVTDATMAFRGKLPGGSIVRIINVTATMAGTTPLFNLQHFYLTSGASNTFAIQRVRATWTSGAGGSVVQLGGSVGIETGSLQLFHVSEVAASGAAHMLEITPKCTAAYCLASSGGLIAFDLIDLRDAKGAFLYSNGMGCTLAAYDHGMVRFSNITITGGQHFMNVLDATYAVVYNGGSGNMLFSAITTDGMLFDFSVDKPFGADGTQVKFTFHHIRSNGVFVDPSSFSRSVPSAYNSVPHYDSWNWYMSNITITGALQTTLTALESAQKLYGSQLVDSYGAVQENRGSSWPTATVGSASKIACVVDRDSNARFVPLENGRQRSECVCTQQYYPPYCTTVRDPLTSNYDAYVAEPATCRAGGEISCASCLFGDPTACGGCPFGSGLNEDRDCEVLPCLVPNCSSCQLGSSVICTACNGGYRLSDDQRACLSSAISHCSEWTADGVCSTCEKGYKLNDKGQCKKKGTPWWVWLIVGIAAAAVVAGVIVLVVCCLRRRRGGTTQASRTAGDTSHSGQFTRDESMMAMGTSSANLAGPSSAYQWSFEGCDTLRGTQGSQVAIANPLNDD